ncbi:ABC transporter ATP-binding protein [Tersicoccus solisilvae]|uniref:ABC transporter ATP-binding protein n=1 Tax=Tersicoccus solisilvae TaxID=1882339 RepID=A0ABQ1P111_9MICC|nr:metal ABC transporter ATP-binding protein [Tersicoccus solisilvae]GGC86935.1 ABC transporter ATP-binding protein [Tersicoccus solisilvae]
MTPVPDTAPAARLAGATLSFGDRRIFDGLDLTVEPGEFLAVLGPNGSGKTTLLRTLLGLQHLDAGTVTVGGRPPGRAASRTGYIPQQRPFAPYTPLRARDLVGLGLDGTRLGPRVRRREHTRRVDELLERVGATGYADAPVGALSGGEQQRLRVAQALATDPDLLLCDEPLLSLDLKHQQAVSALIDRRRTEHGTAVVFVTHEINPVLEHVDRVLYLVGGRFRLGTPAEVLRTDVLSQMYGTRVEVIQTGGRLVVVGLPDATTHHHHHDEEN